MTSYPAPDLSLPEPSLSFAFEVVVDVAPAARVGGPAGSEQLWVVPILGGTVAGPRLSGTVVPGGADWFTDRDGVVSLDARYVLESDDGALVAVHNVGFWRASDEVTARLDSGEPVDEREYYYRTSASFVTESPALRWLTETVVVGLARQHGPRISIRFFALT